MDSYLFLVAFGGGGGWEPSDSCEGGCGRKGPKSWLSDKDFS